MDWFLFNFVILTYLNKSIMILDKNALILKSTFDLRFGYLIILS